MRIYGLLHFYLRTIHWMWNIKRILRHTIRNESGKCALLYYMSVWLNGRKTKTKTKQKTAWTRTITHICCVLKFECAAIAVQIKKNYFFPVCILLFLIFPTIASIASRSMWNFPFSVLQLTFALECRQFHCL